MFKHYLSTVLGVLIAAIGAFSTVANLDSIGWKQATVAFTCCLLYAIKGAIQADASQVPPLPAQAKCPLCGK